MRATLSVMDPDGKNQRILARGLRNAVGLQLRERHALRHQHGSRSPGRRCPDDTMFALDSNQRADGQARNYGWPYCYFQNGKVLPIRPLQHHPSGWIAPRFRQRTTSSPRMERRWALNILMAPRRVRNCETRSWSRCTAAPS